MHTEAAHKLLFGIIDGAGSCKRAHERGKLRLQNLTTQARPCHPCRALQGGCDFLLERRSENYKLEDLICASLPVRLFPYMIS